MIYSFTVGENQKMSSYFDILDKFCDFCFCKRTFYINTNLSENSLSEKLPNVKFSPVLSSDLNIIDSPMVKRWCQDIFVKKELDEFEKTEACQTRLREINRLIDEIEKGGVAFGQTKEESSGKSTETREPSASKSEDTVN